MPTSQSKITHLQHWFKHVQKKQHRLTSLADAIFYGQFNRYQRYRLRYFAANTLIIFLLHVIEFTILFHSMRFNTFYQLLVLRSIALVISGATWGLLELLRAKVRQLKRTQQMQLIGQYLQCYLFITSLLALAIIMSVMTFLFFHTPVEKDTLYFNSYAMVIAFDLALSCFCQCIHAGVYGLRRVYRPFWSIPFAMITGLLVLIGLWPLVHQYSLIAAIMTTSICQVVLSLYFSLKTYRLLDIEPPKLFKLPKLNIVMAQFRHSEMALSTLSSIFIQGDGIILLFLLDKKAFIAFYLLAPLIRACCQWPRLFYFDLKRLNQKAWHRIRMIFTKKIEKTLLYIPIALAIIACISLSLIQPAQKLTYVTITLFFCIQALLSFSLMREYCQNHYIHILISMSTLIACLIITRLYITGINATFLCITTSSALAWLILHIPCKKAINHYCQEPRYNFYAWLQNEKEFHKVYRGFFSTGYENKIPVQHPISTTRIDSSSFLFILEKPTFKNKLIESSAGTLSQLNKIEPNLLHYFTDKLKQTPFKNTQEISTFFNQHFHQGHIFNFDQEAFRGHYGQNILALIQQHLEAPLRFDKYAKYHISVLYDQKGVQNVFVIKNELNKQQTIKQWQRRLFLYHLKQRF